MPKILIVEDEISLLKILTDQFTIEKFDVLNAKDGKEGLESALQNHPDIILLDINMPVMNGLDMLQALRQDVWGKDAPVVVLSSSQDSESISAGLNHKVLKYYIKSDWKIEDLIKEVKEMLDRVQQSPDDKK